MQHPKRRLIGAGILAALTAAAAALACLLPAFWFSFYTDFSRCAMRVLGAVFGWIPVPIWELALVLGLLALPVVLVRAVRKKQLAGFFAGLLELTALLAALFMGLWGLNHFAPTIGEQTGLEVRGYSEQELREAAVWYSGQASALSGQVERDADGTLVLPAFSALSDEAVAAYAQLGAENSRFANPVQQVKPLLASRLFAYFGTTGVFLCLTGEAGASTETFGLSLPFTICHELGHSLAVARENEANYLGFLACRASDSPLFQYSGYYSAFVYCFNALYAENAKSAQGLWDLCSDEMLRDSRRHVSHNRQYEGKVQQAAQAVNNAYLKTFTEEGVKSYGLVVDYLIAEYFRASD